MEGTIPNNTHFTDGKVMSRGFSVLCAVQIPHCSAQPPPGPSHLLPRAPVLFFSNDEIRIWVGGLAEQEEGQLRLVGILCSLSQSWRREGGGTLLANPGPDPQTFPSWPRPTPHFPKVLGSPKSQRLLPPTCLPIWHTCT